jgi:hypothetical protein
LESHDTSEVESCFLHRMPKPIVAKMRGADAAACDLVIAEEEAVFTLAYCNIGTRPDGSSRIHLPRAIGPTHVYGMAKTLMYRSLENEFEAQLQMEAECFADLRQARRLPRRRQRLPGKAQSGIYGGVGAPAFASMGPKMAIPASIASATLRR